MIGGAVWPQWVISIRMELPALGLVALVSLSLLKKIWKLHLMQSNYTLKHLLWPSFSVMQTCSRYLDIEYEMTHSLIHAIPHLSYPLNHSWILESFLERDTRRVPSTTVNARWNGLYQIISCLRLRIRLILVWFSRGTPLSEVEASLGVRTSLLQETSYPVSEDQRMIGQTFGGGVANRE